MAFVFDDTWQLGYITSTCDQELEASINLLKSCKNGQRYYFPDCDITLDISFLQILCNVTLHSNKKNNELSLYKGDLTKFSKHFETYKKKKIHYRKVNK